MWDVPSPFIFDGPVPPDQLIGRQREADTLRQWTEAGRFMALVAPRRFGKTSLVAKVAQDAARSNLSVIVADLFEVASLADLVLRLERAWGRQTPNRLRSAVSRILSGAQVGVSIAGSGFAVTLADKPNTDPLPALHVLLDLPTRLAGRRNVDRTLIVLDEFQSVGAVPGAEALIRSYAQHQRQICSYLFCGSEPGMLATAFDDRARPFYGQVEMFRLERLGAQELTEAIESRFQVDRRDVSEVIGDLVRVSEGHPQRAMLLAHLLWQRVGRGQAAGDDDWDAVLQLALRRIDPEARATMSGMPAGHRKVVRAIAEYGSPMASRALHALALPKTTAQRATAHLLAGGVIEREADSGWRLVDPLLGHWISANYGTRS